MASSLLLLLGAALLVLTAARIAIACGIGAPTTFLLAIFVIAAREGLDAAANAPRDEPAAVNCAGAVGGTISIDSWFVVDNYWVLSRIASPTLDGSDTLNETAGVIWGNGAIWDDVGINGPTHCGTSVDSETLDATSLTILWYNGSLCGR